MKGEQADMCLGSVHGQGGEGGGQKGLRGGVVHMNSELYMDGITSSPSEAPEAS